MAIVDVADNAKERVLVVHNYYQIGGGEHSVFENEVRLLREHGHFVLTYTRDNNEINKSVLKKLLLPFSTVFSFKTYRDIKTIIKSNKIDIVHCHNTFPLISPAVYYAAWKCGVQVLQTIHNFRFLCANGVCFRQNAICEECLLKGLRCGIKHKCYRDSRLQTMVLVNMLWIHRVFGTYRRLRYIFLTDFNKRKFESLLGARISKQFVKPNFAFVEDETVSSGVKDGSFVFVGRLEPQKGIDFVLDNWEHNNDLYIFGSGEMKEYVEQICQKNDKIHYMGFQSRETIRGYLEKATAMLFPTDLYEGFPMTIVEAFATGTPVVCSDIGNGASIVLESCAGVAYSRRSKEAFLNAIKDVEKNHDYYSKNAILAYEQKYTPESNYQQLKSIYEAVLR